MAMIAASLLLLASGVAALKEERLLPHNAKISLSRLSLSGHPGPLTPLKITEHIVTLRRETSMSLSSVYVQALRRQAMAAARDTDERNGSASLTSVEAGQVFLAPIDIGGQTFEVVVDTGSSDPWVVTPNYECINARTGAQQSETYCEFGPAYNPTTSYTYQHIPNQNFNITYSDQEMLNGVMGYDSFTLGGITVPQQKFGLVDYAAWYGDGYSSGLVGFAYGTLTSAYSGTNPTQDHRGATLLYNPLFVNMYNLSLIAPVFSLAIDRDPNNGGLLALGGIPNIPHSPDWVSTPILSVGVFVGTTTPAYEFYSINADGWAISSSASTQFNPFSNANPHKTNVVENGTVIVDSGTSLVYAPNDVAADVAAAFNPPGNFDRTTGAYMVSCNAVPPVFGVSIENKVFFVNGADLMVPSAEGQCISGVQPSGGGLTILGDVWMKNVISVFDIGAEMMRFAAREYYGLTSTSRPPPR